MSRRPGESLGLLEVRSWSLSAVLADHACHAAKVRVLGMESSGGDTVMIRIGGGHAEVAAALAAMEERAATLGVETAATLVPRPEASVLWPAPNAIQPLYQHREQFLPDDYPKAPMNESTQALGILETQGLAAALEAADAMLKTASVSLVGKEKIGAAYVTIVVRGDVAAVQSAVSAGQAAAATLGKVIAAHIISRPHPEMLALLPK